METKEKIDILLKEYDMLRIEARDRMRGRLVIVGYFTVLAAFLKTQTQLSLFWVFVFAGIILGGVWFYFWILLKRLSMHLMELEKRINSLAGEELLTWEQKIPRYRMSLLSRVLDKLKFNRRN